MFHNEYSLTDVPYQILIYNECSISNNTLKTPKKQIDLSIFPMNIFKPF